MQARSFLHTFVLGMHMLTGRLGKALQPGLLQRRPQHCWCVSEHHEDLCALQGINSFCRELGITRSDSVVHLHKLDFHVRAHLDTASPRCLAVLHPLRLILSNLPEDFLQHLPGRVSSHSSCPAALGPICLLLITGMAVTLQL